MDFNDSPREAEVRAEVRACLEREFPAWKQREGDPGPQPWPMERQRSWQRVLAEHGWGAPGWPAEYGGRDFGPVEQAVWAEEKRRVSAQSPFNIIGFGMAGPTIATHGSPEQKQRYLPPLLRGEEIWCQLFSEPGAGSDLAGISTRAVRDGDAWIVTGQKVWSSDAHVADLGILLARHDFEQPKHKGMVYLLCDMHAPGVEVRPLRQVSGEAHFNEVFLSEVRIPDAARMGEPGEGWDLARTTLLFERMSLGSAAGGYTYPWERLVQIAREHGTLDGVARDDLVRIWTKERLLDLLNKRILSKLGAGQIPAAEGSVLKLLLADLGTDAAMVGLRLQRARGTVFDRQGPQYAFLWERAMHLGGGTDEVQRNVIAERVLGMPRDTQPDRDLPFSQTRR